MTLVTHHTSHLVVLKGVVAGARVVEEGVQEGNGDEEKESNEVDSSGQHSQPLRPADRGTNSRQQTVGDQ